MRLFFSELKKLFGRKQFMLLSAVLLIMQVFTLYAYERNTEEFYYLYEHKDDYEEVTNPEGEELSVTFYEELEASKKAYAEEYDVFLNEMFLRAERIKNSSIFGGNDPYKIRDLDKTVRDYEKLKGISIVSDHYTSVKKYGAYIPGIIFEILFVLLLLYFGFYEDKEKGYYSLLRSSKHGHAAFASAKFAVFMVFTVIYVILQEALTIGVLSYLYGSGDLASPIQSVPLFRNASMKISILGMYGISALFKILSLFVVMALFFMLGMLFGRIILPVLILAGTVGLELLLWQTIKSTSAVRIFHFVNLFSLFVPSESVGAYANFNLFGYPVGKNVVSCVFFLMVGLTGAVLGVFFFSVRHQVRREGFIERFLLKLRTKLHVLQEGRNLLFLEFFKTLLQQKKILVLILVIYYAVTLIQNALLPVTFSKLEDASYEYYALKLQGEYTERQTDIIQEEEQHIEDMREEMTSYMTSEEGDPEWNKIMAEGLQSQISTYSTGLNQAQMQLQFLDMFIEQDGTQNERHYFINMPRYKRFFSRFRNHLAEWLIAAAAVIFLSAGLHAADEKTGMTRLIRSTKNGRGRINGTRLGVTLILSFAVFLCIAVPDFIRLYRIDGLACMKAPFSDFVPERFPQGLTIGGAYIGALLIRLFSLLGLGVLSLSLSRRLKSEMTTILVLMGAAILIVVFGYLLSTDVVTLILKLGGVTLK